MLTEGIKAPNFTLFNHQHESISLSDFLGKKVVLYFYPKDDTPGCTTQACSFRNDYDRYNNNGIVVIGISKDSETSHKKFIEKYQLPFILLSDPTLDVIKVYDVYQEKMRCGRLTKSVIRSTYIIDENGTIEKVFPNVKPDTNSEEILNYLKIWLQFEKIYYIIY